MLWSVWSYTANNLKFSQGLIQGPQSKLYRLHLISYSKAATHQQFELRNSLISENVL